MLDIKKHSLYKPMEFDKVLSNIFKIYIKKFWPLFIISFMALFLLQGMLFQIGFYGLYKIENPDEMMEAIGKFMSKMGIVSISYVVVYGLLNSILINYLVKAVGESEVHFGSLFQESLKKYAIHMIFFMILATISLLVAMVVGVIAFVIGMLFAALYIGSVLMPGAAILVVEEKNALETIGRTFSMVHKDFWNTFGIFIIFLLIMILMTLIANALISIPVVIMFLDNLKETGNIFEAFNIHRYDLGMWLIVINTIVSAIVYPLYAILSVVMYFKLRYQEDQLKPVQ